MFSCQDDGEAALTTLDESSIIAEISAAELPSAAQDYITSDFAGEVVVEAFKISEPSGEVFFESFLTNNVNVVFESNGAVVGFGEESSRVTCDGRARKRHERRKERREDRRDSTDTDRILPEEITVEDLPEASAQYLAENYADTAVSKVLKVTNRDEEIKYLVLIAQVGIVVFDETGAFLELRERKNNCFNFEEVAIEDLPETVTTYLSENYPDAVILRARQGTIKEVVQTHVLLEDIGVAIFDIDGNFLSLKECMPKS